MEVYYILSALAGLVAVLTGVGYVWRHVRKMTNKVDVFLDDWYGKPARPDEGVPAQKGVMLRLKEQDDVLGDIMKELSMNGSHSVKDVVNQTVKDIAAVKSKVDELVREIK